MSELSPNNRAWLTEIVLNDKDALHLSNAEEYKLGVMAQACGKLIIDTVATLPFQVGTLDSEGQFEENPDSELAKLLKKPNNQENGNDFIRRIVLNFMVGGECSVSSLDTGNSKKQPRKNAKKPLNLYALSRKRVTPIEGGIEGQIKKLEYRPKNGEKKDFIPEQMLFMPFSIDPTDGFRGVGPMDTAVLSAGMARHNIEWMAGLAKNIGLPPATMKFPEALSDWVMQESTMKKLKDVWKRLVTGLKNAGMPLISNADVKPLTWSPNEANVVGLLDSAKSSVQEAFGVPPILVGDLRFSSFSNAREANVNFMLKNALPLGWKIVRALTTWLQSWYPDEVIWINVKSISILQEDIKIKTDAAAKKVLSGIITPNTAAKELGHNKDEMDSDGDKRIIPGNMMPLSSATDEDAHNNDEFK